MVEHSADEDSLFAEIHRADGGRDHVVDNRKRNGTTEKNAREHSEELRGFKAGDGSRMGAESAQTADYELHGNDKAGPRYEDGCPLGGGVSRAPDGVQFEDRGDGYGGNFMLEHMEVDEYGGDSDGKLDEDGRRKHEPISWNAWRKPGYGGDESYDNSDRRKEAPSSVIVKDSSMANGGDAQGEEKSRDEGTAEKLLNGKESREDKWEAEKVRKKEERELKDRKERQERLRPDTRKRDRSKSRSRSPVWRSKRPPPVRTGRYNPGRRMPPRMGPMMHGRGPHPMGMRPPMRPSMHGRMPLVKMRGGMTPRRMGPIPPRGMPPGMGLRPNHVPRPYARVMGGMPRPLPPGYEPGSSRRMGRRPGPPRSMRDSWGDPPESGVFGGPRHDGGRYLPHDMDDIHHPRDVRSAPPRERPPADTRGSRGPRRGPPLDGRDIPPPPSRPERSWPPGDGHMSPPRQADPDRQYHPPPPRGRARMPSPGRTRRPSSTVGRERHRYRDQPPPPPRTADIIPQSRGPYEETRPLPSRRDDPVVRDRRDVQRSSRHVPNDIVSGRDRDRDRDRDLKRELIAGRDRERDSPEPKRRALHRDVHHDTRRGDWEHRESPRDRPRLESRIHSSSRRVDLRDGHMREGHSRESHVREANGREGREGREGRDRHRPDSPRNYHHRPSDRSEERSPDRHRSSRSQVESGRDIRDIRENRRGSGTSSRHTASVFNHFEDECAWFYVDPQGSTQGPCTIEQFRGWLKTLAEDPQYKEEHKQFMSVNVWKQGMHRRFPMMQLLDQNRPPNREDRNNWH